MRILLALMCLMFATEVAAHRFAPSLLAVQQLSETTFGVTWKTPIQKVSSTPIEPVLPADCALTSSSPWIQEGTGMLMQMQWDCAAGIVGKTLSVSGLGENQSSALLRVTLADNVFHQAVFTASEPSFMIPEEGSAGSVALDYSWLGAEHIWAGPDHLLFVMGLLLLVGWNRRLIVTVTAFTVGHSVTLAMVTLGLFDYPVSLVVDLCIGGRAGNGAGRGAVATAVVAGRGVWSPAWHGLCRCAGRDGVAAIQRAAGTVVFQCRY
jgi:hypothetical protein